VDSSYNSYGYCWFRCTLWSVFFVIFFSNAITIDFLENARLWNSLLWAEWDVSLYATCSRTLLRYPTLRCQLFDPKLITWQWHTWAVVKDIGAGGADANEPPWESWKPRGNTRTTLVNVVMPATALLLLLLLLIALPASLRLLHGAPTIFQHVQQTYPWCLNDRIGENLTDSMNVILLLEIFTRTHTDIYKYWNYLLMFSFVHN